MMIGWNHLLAATVVVTGVAAGFDLKTGHIPNWLNFGALAAGPVLHLAIGWHEAGARVGFEAAGFSVTGALVCALVPMFLYRADAIGGGDVKLLAAVGAILRPMLGIEAEFYAFLAAAIFAPARLAWEGKLLKTLGNTMALALNPVLPKDKRRVIPKEAMTSLRFGPAIAVGVVVTSVLHWRLGSR